MITAIGKVVRRRRVSTARMTSAKAAVMYVCRCRAQDVAGHEFYLVSDPATPPEKVTGRFVAELAAEHMDSVVPPGRNVRSYEHIVLSARARRGGTDVEAAREALTEAAFDLMRDARLGRRHFGVVSVHDDSASGQIHAHIIVARYAEDGTPLRIRRPEIRRLYGMEFTKAVECEAGARRLREPAKRESRGRARTPYSGRASRAICVELARRIVAGEPLEKLATPARVGPDGVIRSVLYRGARIRVATVDVLVQRERRRVAETAARETQYNAKLIARDAVRELVPPRGVRVLNLNQLDHL